MDVARLKALSVLGYNFGIHMARSLIPADESDQAELFRSYFREDRITSLTEDEHRELLDFEGCVSCGLCPSRCRVMRLAGGRFLGPQHIASAASRSHVDFHHDADSIFLCAACGQCEPICPEGVPVSEMTRAMRAMLWRVAPEALPEGYAEAELRMKDCGSAHGPAPGHPLPGDAKAPAALILGPALWRDPERAVRLHETLTKLGYHVSGFEEGEIGGLARDLGLASDTGWVKALADSNHQEIICADPEAWRELKGHGLLKKKSVVFVLDAINEKLEGADLGAALGGPAAVHDTGALARGTGAWRTARELLGKGGAEVAELEERGPEAPPLGWEGGLPLAEPGLAKALFSARTEDARRAGAAVLVTASPSDIAFAEASGAGDDLRVLYLPDAIHGAIF